MRQTSPIVLILYIVLLFGNISVLEKVNTQIPTETIQLNHVVIPDRTEIIQLNHNETVQLNHVVIPDRTEIVNAPSRGTRTKTITATYYTWTGNQTKTGTWPKEGRTVAVDPKVIPLGSHLIIDGVGGYIAEDTGGLIQGDKIDIYKTSRNECIQLGVKKVKVQILN